LCFPTCFASCASTCSLIALVFDLAMFYIAKTRIDRVSGASASIGVAVWLTLAAWLLCGFAGCAYGIGRCCVGSRNKTRDDPDPSRGGYVRTPSGNGPDAMRMDAIRDEQLRKKEQGLPSFAAFERAPLNDDKYDEPAQNMPGALRRDGSLVSGVGVGYGRRTDARTPVDNGNYNAGYGYPPAGLGRRPSDSMMTDAGDAGLGAGGQGVEPAGYNDPCRSFDDGQYDPADIQTTIKLNTEVTLKMATVIHTRAINIPLNHTFQTHTPRTPAPRIRTPTVPVPPTHMLRTRVRPTHMPRTPVLPIPMVTPNPTRTRHNSLTLLPIPTTTRETPPTTLMEATMMVLALSGWLLRQPPVQPDTPAHHIMPLYKLHSLNV
jgi:hypothetical protein